MAGSQQYSDAQIIYVLRAALQGKSNSWIQEKFQLRFGRSLSDHQARYIKSKYGKDPKFCTPVANVVHGKILTQSSGPNTDNASEDDSCLGIDYEALEKNSNATSDVVFQTSLSGASEIPSPTPTARHPPASVIRVSPTLTNPSQASTRASLPGRKRHRGDDIGETGRLTKSHYEHRKKRSHVSGPEILNYESFVSPFGHLPLLTQDAFNNNALTCLPEAEAGAGTADVESTSKSSIRLLNTSPNFLGYKEVSSIISQQDSRFPPDPQKNKNVTGAGPILDIQHIPISDSGVSETHGALDEFLLYRCYDIYGNINPTMNEHADWLYRLPKEFLETKTSETFSSTGEESILDLVEADPEFLAACNVASAKNNEESVIFPNHFHIEYYTPPIFTREPSFGYSPSRSNANMESGKEPRQHVSIMNSHINRSLTNAEVVDPEELHSILAHVDGTDIGGTVALLGHERDALNIGDSTSPIVSMADGSYFSTEHYSSKLKELRGSSPGYPPG